MTEDNNNHTGGLSFNRTVTADIKQPQDEHHPEFEMTDSISIYEDEGQGEEIVPFDVSDASNIRVEVAEAISTYLSVQPEVIGVDADLLAKEITVNVSQHLLQENEGQLDQFYENIVVDFEIPAKVPLTLHQQEGLEKHLISTIKQDDLCLYKLSPNPNGAPFYGRGQTISKTIDYVMNEYPIGMLESGVLATLFKNELSSAGINLPDGELSDFESIVQDSSRKNTDTLKNKLLLEIQDQFTLSANKNLKNSSSTPSDLEQTSPTIRRGR